MLRHVSPLLRDADRSGVPRSWTGWYVHRWPLIEASYFGDAQEEAWEILFRKQHGLVARVESMQGSPALCERSAKYRKRQSGLHY